MRFRIAIVAAGAAVGSLIAAGSAQAVSCANLQATIDAAPDGATVTVDQGATCTGPITLVGGRSITLQGAGTGATIDGGGTARAIDGNDVGTTTIRNLTIRNGSSNADGGGIQLGGLSTPTLEDLRFFNNAATATADGGAVYINSDTPTGTVVIRNSVFGDNSGGNSNSAGGNGGAAYVYTSGAGTDVEVTGSQFIKNSAVDEGGGLRVQSQGGDLTLANNVFSGNFLFGPSGSGLGGGAYVEFDNGSPTVAVTGNSFLLNRIAPSNTTGFARGAGLALRSFVGPLAPGTSSGNTFDANSVTAGGAPGAFSPQGGGAYIFGIALQSRNDRFTRNSLPPKLGTGTSWGAGVSLTGCNPLVADDRLENAVVAGNTAGGASRGAGVYVGCGEGPARLTLLDSTVTANTAGSDTAGVWGGGDDDLTVRNSIIAGNTGGADLTGFVTRSVSYTDVCPLHAGAGNLCANPLLVDPILGDVHQTAGSPTVDKGSNALVPGGLTTDFEGNGRIQGAAVDMGADEVSLAGGGGTTQPDTTVPGVSRASLTSKTFAVARGSTPITGQAAAKRKVKRGTTIRYTLSEAATVRLRIDRALRGRRVKKGKRRICAKPTRKNRRKRRCTRYKRAGRTLVRTSHAGRNSVKFSGRIGRKALKRGRYRLTIVATDAAGNKSKPRRLRFRIVKP